MTNQVYRVKFAGTETTFSSLNAAMVFAKESNVFVTIQGPDFEIVGIFGVDAIVNGRCPDGVAYDWNKASRIGAQRTRN
jgi:hypothetical protein